MKPILKWSHAIFLFAAVPLVFELTYIGIMFGMLSNIDYAKKLRTESMNASYAVSRFMVRLLDSGATVIGTELGMLNGGDQRMEASSIEAYQRNYWRGRIAIENSLQDLVKYLASETEYRSFAHSLAEQYSALDTALKAGTRMFRAGDMFESLKLRLKVISYMENMIAISRDFVDRQLTSTSGLEKQESRMKSIMQVVIVTFFFMSFFGAGSLAYLINRTIARKLDTISDNVSKLSAHELSVKPLEGDDEFATLDLAFRNMFEAIVQAQNKERLVVESALDMICMLTENGVFTRVNPACERMLGRSQEEMVGCEIQEFVVGQERQLALHSFQLAIDSNDPVAFEIALLDSQGSQIDTLWSVTWSHAEQSHFCVVHDITERKQAELLRQEITAMISHDLRTPITSIQVALDLINAGAFGELPEQLRNESQSAGTQSMEAMDLINDLLDIEKFENSEMEVYLRPHLLTDLIESAWRDIRPGAEPKGIELEVACADVNVLVDRDQFVRMLRNLLRNSVAYSPVGSSVRISSEEDESECGITIEDGGPLVPEDQKLTAFDRFQSADSVDASRVVGNGLSLSVCKYLALAHGGELTVGQTPAGKFIFSLTCNLESGADIHRV